MTNVYQAAQQALEALEALIENARLLGATQSKKGFGCYSQEDAMLERAWYEGIAKHSHTLRAALTETTRTQKMRDAGYTRRPTLREMAEPDGFLTSEGNKAEPERCVCGDRMTDQCPGEWEPECDLGNNPMYARRVAKPVQEPVAWGWRGADGQIRDCIAPDTHAAQEGEYTVPLYTAPPQRKPLSEDEIFEAIKGVDSLKAVEVARAIEAAHGIGGGDE